VAHDEHATTINAVRKVVDIATATGKFDETVLFRGANAAVLKEEFKDHFRNVTRIMDCVGCDKCRLWGKVQTTGVATALKILFEMDEKALEWVHFISYFMTRRIKTLGSLPSPSANSNLLSHTEVVALINTLHRFTESLHAVDLFRRMWRETSEDESEQLKRSAESILRQVRPTLF
jgi:ERO1-like protein beta